MCSSAPLRHFPPPFARFRCDVRPTTGLPLAVGGATARRVEVAYETTEQRLVYLDLLASEHVTGKTVECTFLGGFSGCLSVVSCGAHRHGRIVRVSWKSDGGKLGKTAPKVGNILTCNIVLSVYVGDAVLPDRAWLPLGPGCQAGEERFNNAMWFGRSDADSWMLVVR